MTDEKKSYFNELYNVDVREHVEKKNGLSYLSWAWAWAEVKKRYPDSTYTIYEDANGRFYHSDGYTAWVKTGVTVNGIEYIEYLPVMDFKNNSIPVTKLTSFDVNKAIQRSLTKAIARHGLGLYIYAGEDLPEDKSEPKSTTTAKPKAKPAAQAPEGADKSLRQELVTICKSYKIDLKLICKMFKLNNSSPDESFREALDYCKTQAKKMDLANAVNEEAVEPVSEYPEEV